MQFRHLTFSAIGPFPGTHTINFDDLTASGLFLFDGPTGAGKSSIIDAIVFALYGDVAGSDSDRSRMRSSYAPGTVESVVELVFTIASGTYRVRRTPAYLKQKVRGEGTTPIGATAHLWRMSEAAVEAKKWEAGEILGSKISQVDAELEGLLGLTREQFVQTVVLPQGQFAQFLKMKSTERAALLETLFNTSDYKRFAYALEDAAKEARGKVKAASEEAIRALHSWLDIDGVAEQFPHLVQLVLEPDDEAPLEAIAEADHVLGQAWAAASELTVEVGAAARQAAQALQQAEILTAAIAERGRLVAERAVLAERAPRIEEARAKIAAHESVALAIDRLNREDSAREALSAIALPAGMASAGASGPDAAATEPSATGAVGTPAAGAATVTDIDSLASAIAAQEGVLEAAESVIDSCDAELAGINTQLGALAELAALEAGLSQRREELAGLEKEAEALQARAAELDEQLAAYPSRAAEFDSALQAKRTLAATAPVITEKLASQQAAQATATKLTDVEGTLERARGTLVKAAAAHSAQREKLNATTEAWRRSMASNLASTLSESEPCPVCGSTEHPAPAAPAADSATLEQVQAEEAALAPLAAALDQANQKVTALSSSAEALRSQLGDATPESIAATIVALTADLAKASAAEKNAAAMEAERAALEDAQAKQRLALGQVREDQRALTERTASASQMLGADTARVSDARGEFPSVHDRQAALGRQREQLSSLRAVATTAASAARSLEEARAAASEALAAAHVTAAQARASHLPRPTLTALKKEVEDHAAQCASIEGQLASERLQVEGQEVDLEAARQADAAARKAVSQANRAEAIASQRMTASNGHLARLRAAHRDWKRISDAAGPAVRLADLANAGSMSLSRVKLTVWVLLRRFEQIVERANEHLARFSFGRYELRRADEGRGELKSGLGLEVVHHDSGPGGDHVRSPGTLSGGETFYTSLALALALSEVVQAENGGIRIDTLLIDEGFGSLSSDYLQTVMDTLGQLRADGRTVGVVSHVEELKAMIPDRVTVKPLGGGGSTMSVSA